MNEWQVFFNRHAEAYDDEVFTRNTADEIAFLVDEFRLPPGASILDVGCGTGRHSIGLALQGFKVTGIDLSREMLRVAEEKRRRHAVEAAFICTNAQDYVAEAPHDAAICLCEGALCLLGSADDPFERDLEILKMVRRALKPGGTFVATVINACRQLRAITDQDVADGRYDLLAMVEISEMEYETPEGKRRITVRERGYAPPELRRLMELAGFRVEGLYGGTAGAWRRKLPRLDEMELMVIARAA